MTQSNEGGKMYKIRVRDVRTPEIGDKFAARHETKRRVGYFSKTRRSPIYCTRNATPDVLINHLWILTSLYDQFYHLRLTVS